MSKISFKEKLDSYLDGAQDCRNGKPHQEHRGEYYDLGFNQHAFCEDVKQRRRKHKISELGKLL